MLTSGVMKVAEWLESLGLWLNSRKTQAMFVTPRGKSQPEGKVSCSTAELETVHTSKSLGLHLDNDLQWSTHIAMIKCKVTQLAGIMWRNGQALTLIARRTWLLGLVRSQLTYASNAFYPSRRNSDVDQLNSLFKFGGKQFSGCTPKFPCPLAPKIVPANSDYYSPS